MTLKQKLKIRFKIISSIIFTGLIVLLFLWQYNPKIICEEWLLGFECVIGAWFWFDKKLLYIKNQLIISLLLCLTFLIVVILIIGHSFIATIPLASMIGRIIVNKIMERNLETEEEEDSSVEGRVKIMIYWLITAVISCVIYLIIKSFFYYFCD